MKTSASEEITLREGLASKSTVKYSGFARFEKDLRGGRGEERRGASLSVVVLSWQMYFVQIFLLCTYLIYVCF